jgi:pectin methylesterase-like acyl-CoA thioesterase
VEDIVYRDVCLRGTRTPLDISTHYEQAPVPGTAIPSYAGIRMERVHSVTPGRIILQGYDAAHPLVLTVHNVVVDRAPDIRIEHARILGADGRPANLDAPGAAGIPCAERFLPFPAEPASRPAPQLTDAQARAYAIGEVLRYTGPVGHERIDPWDPLADPLVTQEKLAADYTVDPRARADGVTRFATVQAAVSRAVLEGEAGRRRRIVIRIVQGVYEELVYVPPTPAPITLLGDGPDPQATRITARLDASTTGPEYLRRHAAQFAHAAPAVRAMHDALKDAPVLQTTGSATVWVQGDGFQARNLTIENGYNRNGDDSGGVRPQECGGDRCPDNTGGSRVHHQAVALRVDGADRVQFERVRLLGLQDTLFLHSRDGSATVRSFFNRSHVEGDVDFIFGDTIAYFNDCEIRRRTQWRPTPAATRATASCSTAAASRPMHRQATPRPRRPASTWPASGSTTSAARPTATSRPRVTPAASATSTSTGSRKARSARARWTRWARPSC